MKPSIINDKTIADFTRMVEQTGILARQPPADAPTAGAMVGATGNQGGMNALGQRKADHEKT
jgi:hypothetical protein